MLKKKRRREKRYASVSLEGKEERQITWREKKETRRVAGVRCSRERKEKKIKKTLIKRK